MSHTRVVKRLTDDQLRDDARWFACLYPHVPLAVELVILYLLERSEFLTTQSVRIVTRQLGHIFINRKCSFANAHMTYYIDEFLVKYPQFTTRFPDREEEKRKRRQTSTRVIAEVPLQ
jgi:hypothetical protein